MFFAMNVKLQINGNAVNFSRVEYFIALLVLQAKFFSFHTEKQSSYVEISVFFLLIWDHPKYLTIFSHAQIYPLVLFGEGWGVGKCNIKIIGYFIFVKWGKMGEGVQKVKSFSYKLSKLWGVS